MVTVGKMCFSWYYSGHNSRNLLGISTTHSLMELLEKLPIVQLLVNFPAFYGTRRFNTAFT
jgi:hypothetical protein